MKTYAKDDAACWEHAVKWVKANRLKILSNVRKYEPYSPYSRGDFLQTAYLAAFEAATVFGRKGGEYEPYFWTCLKKLCCLAATNPSMETAFGMAGCKTPVPHDGYAEHGDGQRAPTDVAICAAPETELTRTRGELMFVLEANEKHAAAFKRAIRELLTQREAQTLECLLGLSGGEGRMTLKRTANKLGGTHQSIAAARDRGFKKLGRAFARRKRKTFDIEKPEKNDGEKA